MMMSATIKHPVFQVTLLFYSVSPSESAPIPMVPKLYCISKSTGVFAKTQIAGPELASDSVGIGSGLRIGISNKFPGDVDTCGPSGKPLPYSFHPPQVLKLTCCAP